jgi:chemotaxis signal transduction protein
MKCLTFRASNEYFGMEVHYISRVEEEVKVTPVPFLPPYHLGLMYYRGELFDVIHIQSLLKQEEPACEAGLRGDSAVESSLPSSSGAHETYYGLDPAPIRRSPRVILIKWSDKRLALIPDEVIGLIWIENDNGKHPVYMHGDYVVNLINPEEMWKRLTEFPYGSDKV